MNLLKTMIIIFIGINGLVPLKTKPINQSINGEYYLNNILKPLETILNVDNVKKRKKKNYVHFDNALLHLSQLGKDCLVLSPFQQLIHPPYLTDLAPCDFRLFGTMKNAFKGLSFSSEEELLNAIKNFF